MFTTRTILFLLGLTLGLPACLADIRPPTLATDRDVGPAASRRGRELLSAARDRYGSEKDYRAQKTGRLILTDEWHAPLARAVAMHWDHNGQRMQLDWNLLSDNARLQILDGPAKGKSFGLVNGRTYEANSLQDAGGADGNFVPGRPDAPRVVNNADYKFALQTILYFMEFPYRIMSADIVAYAGQRELDGQMYDMVFVSWNDARPQEDVDQYIVYINRRTGLMDRLHYTIREKFRFTTASCIYSDFQRTDGFLFPRKITLVTAPDQKDDVFHEMTVFELELGGALPVDYLNPALDQSADPETVE